MFFSGGFYSSLGAGRLLVKESIWLDSLTNCIKRQSCPWSAPQLIDGSTHSHRKSSRQNGGKSVACRCSPPFLPPSLARYLPTSPLSLLTLPLFTQMPYDSNVFKTKSNSFQPLCFAKNGANVHQQHTNVLIRHFICKFAVELNDSEFMLWGCYKIKKKPSSVSTRWSWIQQPLKNKNSVAILRDIIILWCEKQGICRHTV